MRHPTVGQERIEDRVVMMTKNMKIHSWLIFSTDASPTLLVYGADEDGRATHRYMDIGHTTHKSQMARGKIRRTIARFLLRFVI